MDERPLLETRLHRSFGSGLGFVVIAAAVATLIAPATGLADTTVSGDLPRRAELGFTTTVADGELVVRDVEDGSAAADAGLQQGDRIVAVDGQPFDRPHVGRDLLRRLLGDRDARLEIARDGSRQEIRFTPPPRPLENVEGVDSHYGVVDVPDGSRLRTVVTRPADAGDGPLPAIFFVQWVSCGSIEIPADGGGPAHAILAALARRPGTALIRVERTASGDSRGPGCHELDYDTELAHYRRAFDELVRDPGIDEERVVIYGSSLGATMAPLLARDVLADGGSIAGVMVQGGGAVTYYERMLAFDRAYLERRPEIDPRTVQEEMLDRARFHYEYLVEGRSPDDVAGDGPAMAAVRADVLGLGDGVHYGRPYAWHQQAADHDLLAAWAEVTAPVLVVFNEFDQYESRHGHELIAATVNRLRPGTATYVEQPRTGHSNRVYPTIEDAYAGRSGVAFPEQIAEEMLDWLRIVL